jgi:hypothetical protein
VRVLFETFVLLLLLSPSTHHTTSGFAQLVLFRGGAVSCPERAAARADLTL